MTEQRAIECIVRITDLSFYELEQYLARAVDILRGCINRIGLFAHIPWAMLFEWIRVVCFADRNYSEGVVA